MKTTTKKQPKPKIKIELSQTDRFLELFSVLILLGIWIMALWNFRILPETVPSHFNTSGEIDQYDNKILVFFIPAIATISTIALLILSRHPHKYNYPFDVSEQTAPKVYAFSVRMIRTLNLGMLAVFAVTELMIVRMTHGLNEKFAIWMMLVFAILTITAFIYSVRKMSKLAKGV